MHDEYFTIKSPVHHEIKVRGSHFIGETALVTTHQEAAQALEIVRKREHAASHHCFAYRVGTGDEAEFKYSDDGEPSGTAGRPIFDVLCGRNLTDTLVVVTRYFGGTKLGTGGLARAYSEAARLAIEKSGTQRKFITERLSVVLPFSCYDQANRVIHKFEVTQTDAEFAHVIRLSLEVRASVVERLIVELTEITGGRAVVEIVQGE
ncbi:MAG: YigZ family protein [Candidatus Zixiibacteriota bacterium]